MSNIQNWRSEFLKIAPVNGKSITSILEAKRERFYARITDLPKGRERQCALAAALSFLEEGKGLSVDRQWAAWGVYFIGAFNPNEYQNAAAKILKNKRKPPALPADVLRAILPR